MSIKYWGDIMGTTRWVEENCEKTLDQSISALLSNHDNIDHNNRDTVVYRNWNVEKISEQNRQINLNDRIVNFNLINYSVDRILPGTQPEVDRTTHIHGFIIPYQANSSVNYIINRNSDAQRLLRKMLGYSGKSEIAINMPNISSDMFFWMINRVYNNEIEIGDNDSCEESILIQMLRGVKGDSEDSLSKVSTSGETVMNIISTLSLFLESRNLDQVKLDISYGEHNIELTLNAKGRISVDLNKYYGPYQAEHDLCIAYLYMLTYIEIVPNLNQAYLLDIQNNEWNSTVNIQFLRRVADDLTERVDEKISIIESTVTDEAVV